MANTLDRVLLQEFEKRRSQLASELIIGKRNERWAIWSGCDVERGIDLYACKENNKSRMSSKNMMRGQ